MAHDHATNNSYLTRTASLPSSTLFTVSFWARTVSGAGMWRALFQLAGGGSDIWLGISDTASGNDVELWLEATTFVDVGSHSLNEWYWFGLVSSASNNRTGYRSLGLGTISSATHTANASFTPSTMWIGNSTASEPCYSEIAAVKIWDAALTLDELRAERLQVAPVRLANLHLWTPCWDATDTRDWGPAGRNWTVNGTIARADGPPIPFRRRRRPVWRPVATPTIDQIRYRWRLDDGDESGAGWAAAENAGIAVTPGTRRRLRVQLAATGNPAAAAFRLEFRRQGTSTWIPVE